jgi:hypothetical protein
MRRIYKFSFKSRKRGFGFPSFYRNNGGVVVCI